ncbi:G-type lectin S-receptor-like serine threonine-kinase RKS1 [Olea europaea subsp. europaea]|uniref:non-specific serine/threonine protein kinase n=1 Tax=Olea europaea subsp. europaea TaxID=158383 RepID=A0A8S0U3E5_OLEEU|nr:G-type lectin S-receptor-like serine threonine-kinase RKS1 [Olea europaea subsp. europaea]
MQAACLRNCSCVAYAMTNFSGCMAWFGDLLDIREYSEDGQDLYVWMPASEIGPNQTLKDGNILVSSGKAFVLGFFGPEKSSNRYVGIWYNKVPEQTVVWVANRDNPIKGTSGVLAIDTAGNLVLFDGNHNFSVWSTNVTSMTLKKSPSAQLMETGNFVLFQDQSKSVITWQSFDYPTNTLLPNMKAGWNRRTGLNTSLSSWKSFDDPGTGDTVFKMELTGTPQFYLLMGTKRLWRTGPWNGLGWSGVPEMVSNFIFKILYVENDNEVTISYSIKDPSIFSRMVVNESGTLERLTWQGSERGWVRFWYVPTDPCDSYAHCGAFSNCDLFNLSEFECSCLPGFEPKLERQWYLRDASNGCKRKQGENICGNGDGFKKVINAKVPDTSIAHVNKSLELKECQELCLKNCSCTAFATANISGGNGCISWHGNLADIRQFSNKGQDLYIRVPAVEIAQDTRNSKGFRGKRLMATVIVLILAMLLILFLAYWLLKKKRKGTEGQIKRPFSFNTGLASYGGRAEEMEGSGTNVEVSIFDLSTIVSATEDFSLANKLGEGGFGAVYKGRLPNGQEIAVKRLSAISGQGNEEFKNEIKLIARLQHRNLVRLLGCCIQQDEKMLVYEYLPNKGLDYFIFDEARRSLMDWSKRFEIILGITRGMIYLHEDSRLRIIHRDLKASNILLDTSMNPKISDFGLARIFGVDQAQANTNRVVGTYGYMSPEYAMEGLFSVKSDVYSFGVLLLEIICGRKNSSYFEEDTVNLIGYVWDLWREEKALDLVDSSLDNSYDANKVLRCVHVGLLCLQEYAPDWPTMSEVLFMLCNETTLPYPKKPAFIFKKDNTLLYSSSASVENRSVNEMSITVIEAR